MILYVEFVRKNTIEIDNKNNKLTKQMVSINKNEKKSKTKRKRLQNKYLYNMRVPLL